MIDKKKMEEAAIAFDNKAEWTEDADVQAIVQYSFKKGAAWALQEFKKSLWHDASKEPRFGEWLLLNHGGSDLSININGRKHTWKNKVDILEINRWCYADDILPEEG